MRLSKLFESEYDVFCLWWFIERIFLQSFSSQKAKSLRKYVAEKFIFDRYLNCILYYNSWNYIYIDEQDYCVFRAFRKVSEVTTSIALFTICFASFSKGNLTSSQSAYFTSYHVLAIQLQQLCREQKFYRRFGILGLRNRVTEPSYAKWRRTSSYQLGNFFRGTNLTS